MDGNAKLQISELLARSAIALDQKDLDTLSVCFHAEAVFELHINNLEPQIFTGQQEIMGLMAGALEAQTDVRRHVISNLMFEVISEGQATAVSYLTLFGTEEGVTRLITTGVYTDQVARASSDADWLLVNRHLYLDAPF